MPIWSYSTYVVLWEKRLQGFLDPTKGTLLVSRLTVTVCIDYIFIELPSGDV